MACTFRDTIETWVSFRHAAIDINFGWQRRQTGNQGPSLNWEWAIPETAVMDAHCPFAPRHGERPVRLVESERAEENQLPSHLREGFTEKLLCILLGELHPLRFLQSFQGPRLLGRHHREIVRRELPAITGHEELLRWEV